MLTSGETQQQIGGSNLKTDFARVTSTQATLHPLVMGLMGTEKFNSLY